MIAAELRGSDKPSLNEALGWIGSRVDDIYGANVGRLEDVWIDPGTGAPRWLLVKEGRFGGRTTLIPFEDATAGAGHVWVPYEREIVRQAPEIEPGAPLTHHVEASLRSHYAARSPQSISGRSRQEAPAPSEPQQPDQVPGFGTATVRLHGSTEAAAPPAFGEAPVEPSGLPPYELPSRPAPPIAAPQPSYEQPPQPPAHPQQPPSQPYSPPPTQYAQPSPPPQSPGWTGQPSWVRPLQAPPPPDPVESLRSLADSPEVHYVEIELSGELSIRGELRSVRIVPRR